MSGNSSEMASALSPNRSSMVSTWPPGSVIRLVSSAPSTEVYQAAAASGFRVTRWQVSELIPPDYTRLPMAATAGLLAGTSFGDLAVGDTLVATLVHIWTSA